jgi:hypothetical protein
MSISIESSAMPRRGGRPRSTRPERITLGSTEYVRNDVIARELAVCERTINRGDIEGAPYRYFGGCKYRPAEQYAAFIASGIQSRKPLPPKRRRTTAP